MKRVSLALYVAAALTMVSCNSYVSKGVQDIKPVSKDQYNTVSFQMVYNLVIKPRCYECHHVEKDHQPDLTSYQKVMRFVKVDNAPASDIYNSLQGAGGNMPRKQAAITKNQLNLMQLWIQIGAPEFAGKGHTPVDVPTGPLPEIQIDVEPTWASLNQKVFVPYCVKCHEPHPNEPKDKDKLPDGGVDFTSYTNLQNSETEDGLPIFSPGNPDLSSLVDVMLKGTMPRPKSKPRIAQNVTAAIVTWIKNGAKEKEDPPPPPPAPAPVPAPSVNPSNTPAS